MSNCITTVESRIINLDYYQDFNIETHTADPSQYVVRANPSRNAASADGKSLFRGTQDACKAYIRDTLAPKLNIDTSDPQFVAAFGVSKAPAKTKPAPTSKKANGGTGA